jgi:hypothetical protein
MYDIVLLLKCPIYMACRKILQHCGRNYTNVKFSFKIPLENWTLKISNIIYSKMQLMLYRCSQIIVVILSCYNISL